MRVLLQQSCVLTVALFLVMEVCVLHAFCPSPGTFLPDRCTNSITSQESVPFRSSLLPRKSSAEDDAASNVDDGEDEKVGLIENPPVEPGTHEELMYTLGVNLARQLGDVRPLVEDGNELALVAKGLLDTVIGRLTEQGQAQLLQRRGQDLNQIIAERANNIRIRLEEAGKEMLQKMDEEEGTEKLDTGVIVHILEPNKDSQRPTRSSTVKIHYHGTLPDGTIFDSTLNGDPVTFPLAQVIPGWRDAVLKMHEGETAMVGIPPDQAYGEEGTPDGRIPGGSTLFFKIQLLEVLSAGIGGSPLLGGDGQKIKKKDNESTGGLLGPDGKPL